jgi:pimeloyl-ACP methyl ester carboxylesterase
MRPAMRRIGVPTLLVWGENDPLVPREYGEAMQREIPGSRLVVLPRAAHVAMWDAPAAFNDALLQFIDGVETTTSKGLEAQFSWGVAGWSEGIAHREAGARRDIVLVHGLGMASVYFKPLARELFALGWNPIAPDLPGFGESEDGPPLGPAAHAEILAAWADRMNIRDAVWLGHSIGCNTVAHVARIRGDLVRRIVLLGPLWSKTRLPHVRMALMLALDGFRESLRIYRYLVIAYWRTGFVRWFVTWRKYATDMGCANAPAGALVIAGVADPLTDRRCVTPVEVPGAHACTVSHPREVALAIGAPSGAAA